jgi:uncharacterized protein YprB with RNaseH-like and TPR domain
MPQREAQKREGTPTAWMKQTMLPLHDMPASSSESARRLKRSGSRLRVPAKPLDRGIPAALADPARVVFLDLETTGLSWFYDELTIAGWACDGAYWLHVAGDDPSPLLNALEAAHTLVTFNGTLFDLRFLKKTFGELILPPVHIDLRYLAKRAGLTGGQKAIERTLGLPVRAGVEDLDGAAAVLLWHRHLRGDREALVRLVDYNRRDVLGMCGILDEVMDRLNVHPDLLFSRPRFASMGATILQQQFSESAARRRTSAVSTTKFETVFGGTFAERATIVGIDLTGSELRPSGWCVLRGREAEICRVGSDDEMFTRAIDARPALVSIDSPLSMPFGRVRVEDDDPGREQFGIMRRCERELRRRGKSISARDSPKCKVTGLSERL